jgi:hypothetical protein
MNHCGVSELLQSRARLGSLSVEYGLANRLCLFCFGSANRDSLFYTIPTKLIDMNDKIYFTLSQRIYRIRYPSGEQLTLTLCSV